MNRTGIRCLLFGFLVALVILQTSCGTANEGNEVRTDRNTQNGQIRVLEITADDARIPLVRHQGETHISIDDLLSTIGYQYNRDADSMAIGDIDPFYTITLCSQQFEEALIHILASCNQDEQPMIQFATAPMIILEFLTK